jgi:hypothetical protein
MNYAETQKILNMAAELKALREFRDLVESRIQGAFGDLSDFDSAVFLRRVFSDGQIIAALNRTHDLDSS